MRLFVAIDLPDDIADELGGLSAGIPGARWVPPDNMHITLSFIGEADGPTTDDICQALADVPSEPFELELAGVGHFETRNQPHALWIGVERVKPLMQLQASVDAALRRVGVEPERRRYTPHVTLARLKGKADGRLHDFVMQNNLYRSRRFEVEAFTLYSSFLSRSGAIYRAEAEYPLGLDFGEDEQA